VVTLPRLDEQSASLLIDELAADGDLKEAMVKSINHNPAEQAERFFQ
jgi:hypothetical protein